ncbi:unnamed protein product [Owenia fusiformis]|uniref:Uncharacterized protein n=1 Tax=Owenia fusiformis TaxID=6347 RepID=A0A8S4PXN3_OWEFU|nr:unnamed protein product [Owenia fusiformis]
MSLRNTLTCFCLYLCINNSLGKCPALQLLPRNAERILYEPGDRHDPLYRPSDQQLREGFEEGYFATIVCQENYELVPNRPRKCLGDIWSHILIQICSSRGCSLQIVSQVCQPVRCYHPVPCNYSSISPSKQSYQAGETITYDCAGALKAFPSDSRTCQIDGYWSGPDPICVNDDEFQRRTDMKCHKLEAPLFGAIIGPSDRNEVGDAIEFDCDKTYTLLGSHRRVCLDGTLEWSGEQPECVPGLNIDLPTGTNLTDLDRVIPDVEDCRFFYYYTKDGDLFHKICPANLFFNPTLKLCDYQDRSGCEN